MVVPIIFEISTEKATRAFAVLACGASKNN